MNRPVVDNLYAGIAGARLRPEHYDLGNGAELSQTYVHLMAHFIAAFKRPPERQAHPGPWKPAGAAITYDIEAQLSLEAAGLQGESFDLSTAAWWIITLIRLRVSPGITSPVHANASLGSIGTADSAYFRPMEITAQPLIPELRPRHEIGEEDLAWVASHWMAAARIGQAKPDFMAVAQGLHYATHTPTPSLALLSLWALLEHIFSPSHAELRFRISALIAAYLEEPGEKRYARQKAVAKMYDARSKAAHGMPKADWAALIGTYALARDVVTQMIEERDVPNKQTLEAKLFGAHR